jgi:signal transduction histidine kinase
MGLAICRRIVALHDGTLTASSESDTGATFLITLRRTAAVPDAVAPAA